MQEIKMSGESMDIVQDNVEKLKEIFPDVFSENKIDFEKLQNVLGNYIETKEERYNFTWNGKQAALRLAQTPSTGTLRPCKEDSKDWDNTQNLYIEGDNLEVLKLLQKTYHNKIKMIYIDPPYNTGGDFVYEDNFKDSLENYKKITGQIDSEGNPTSTNSETSGRYHSNWLNMMYPRLKLARNLLTIDGVIFISIDDHEVENLIKIADEIFGSTNRLAILVWKKKYTGGKGTSTFADYHEYILAYSKDINNLGEISMARPDEEKDKFIYEDEYKEERGKYYTRPLKSNLDPRPTLVYPIELPDGNSVTTQWICAKDTYEQLKKEGRIEFKSIQNSKYPVYKKFYEYDGGGNIKIPSFIEISNNNEAKEELKDLFGILQTRDLPFPTPKPTKLLNLFVENFTTQDDIILDFFSGSSSTAHTVFISNIADKSNRKFIMNQLPEMVEENSPAGKFLTNLHKPLNIAEIGKERIRRAGEKIKKEIETSNQQLKLGEEPKQLPDIGFKVFKLDTSNIKKWNGDVENIENELQQSIFNHVEDRSQLDIVYEIMLKCGLDLTYPIKEIQVGEKTLYSIGEGAMFVCMDNDITQDIADKIVEIKEEKEIEEPVVVFKDNGFKDDCTKTNIKETLRVAQIKDFITV